MKKYLYIACIILMQSLHGSFIVITQWDIIYDILLISTPVGLLTGVLFTLLGREYKKSASTNYLNGSDMTVKDFKLYDLLYDLYVDSTDCTQCEYFHDCSRLSKGCSYNEDFTLCEDTKAFLIEKVSEIRKIMSK